MNLADGRLGSRSTGDNYSEEADIQHINQIELFRPVQVKTLFPFKASDKLVHSNEQTKMRIKS
jgi:hypothetical protein